MTELFLSELRHIFTKFANFWHTTAKTIELYEVLVHLFSTSPNLCQRTTVYSADALNLEGS